MRLLLYTRKSAKEISSILGFEDLPAFSRFFKKMTGESVSDYRKRVKRGRIANCCGIIAISYVVENKELCKNKNQVILLKPFKK